MPADAGQHTHKPARPRSPLTAPALAVLLGAWGMAQAVPPILPAPSRERPAASQVSTLRELAQIEQDATAAFDAKDYAKAEVLLRRWIELDGSNFVPWYNLACAVALQSRGDEAGTLLLRAVERGFDDVRQMQRDEDLANARTSREFRGLVQGWPQVLIKRRDVNLKGVEAVFSKGYENQTDEARKLVFRTALDETQLRKTRDEIAILSAWADFALFEGLWDPKELALDPYVLVILPTAEDFLGWSVATFGPSALEGNSTIGGSYIHDSKRLIAMDLGATLRHEYFHVLHWRSCVRLGQTHAFWIQEGLCSLVEDYDLPAGARDKVESPDAPLSEAKAAELAKVLKPAPSWRTNALKRRQKGGGLISLERMMTLPRERFLSSNQLANYAHARAVFLYLWEKDLLKRFYEVYTKDVEHGITQDASGIKALELIFSKPIKDIDRDFRVWLKDVPEVAEEIRPGMASLGVEVEVGEGEGPVIVAISPKRDRNGGYMPGPTQGRPRTLKGVDGELKVNDILISIDERPTRDMAELVRVLGECRPGQTVRVRYKRGDAYGTALIELRAKDL